MIAAADRDARDGHGDSGAKADGDANSDGVTRSGMDSSTIHEEDDDEDEDEDDEAADDSASQRAAGWGGSGMSPANKSPRSGIRSITGTNTEGD